MSRTGWKGFEKRAGRLFGGDRFPANMGGEFDFHGLGILGQAKEVKECSLPLLTKYAWAIEGHCQSRPETAGLVAVKLSAGGGNPTPPLVVFTEASFMKFVACLTPETLLKLQVAQAAHLQQLQRLRARSQPKGAQGREAIA